MTPTNLEAIEKLREVRERSAQIALESSNQARDLAGAKATSFKDHLDTQTESVRAQQSQLYSEMVGKHVSSEDLETVRLTVDYKNAELGLLAEQYGNAKQAAIEAGAEADRARTKHARLYRAQQKWTALMSREAERSQQADNYREELTIEDTLRNRSKW